MLLNSLAASLTILSYLKDQELPRLQAVSRGCYKVVPQACRFLVMPFMRDWSHIYSVNKQEVNFFKAAGAIHKTTIKQMCIIDGYIFLNNFENNIDVWSTPTSKICELDIDGKILTCALKRKDTILVGCHLKQIFLFQRSDLKLGGKVKALKYT